MYARERWHDCSVRRTEFVIPGCQLGCLHSLPSKTTVESSTCHICGRLTVETMVSPQCARIDDYRNRRIEIVDRATIELDRLMPIKGWRAAGIAYDKIAGEFFGEPCPFYEPLAEAQEDTNG